MKKKCRGCGKLVEPLDFHRHFIGGGCLDGKEAPYMKKIDVRSVTETGVIVVINALIDSYEALERRVEELERYNRTHAPCTNLDDESLNCIRCNHQHPTDGFTFCTCCNGKPLPPQDTEECICNDYDGKGVSTCGFPCPVHKPQNTEVLREKIYNILLDASCNWIETEEAWKTANKLLALLVK